MKAGLANPAFQLIYGFSLSKAKNKDYDDDKDYKDDKDIYLSL